MEYCFVYKGLISENHVYQDELSSLVISIPDKTPLPTNYLDDTFTTRFKEIISAP